MLLILSGLYFCVDVKADEVEENDSDDLAIHFVLTF